jgi:hypothetical protein
MADIAFARAVSADLQEAQWEVIREPPYVDCYGGQSFVSAPTSQGAPRVFVNGLPVFGIQPVEPGDWVRIIEPDGGGLNYRLGLGAGGVTESGNNRPCAFTGLPIRSTAVRCLACDRLYSQAAVEQIGTCVCGSSLEAQPPERNPGEELL